MATTDKLEFYRWAVQDPRTQITVLRRMYAAVFPGRVPLVLREDFAGTSAEAVEWVRTGEACKAIAVDLDGPTLAWAKQRAERLLGARAGELEFIEGDVLQIAPPAVPAADIISALNFSVLYFHQREALVQYLRHAHESLSDRGLLVMNLFGGGDLTRSYLDKRQVQPIAQGAECPPAAFEYHWEQRSFNGVTGRIDCRIHFVVNGANLVDAFTYDWRLWSLPEMVDCLRDAGFADVQVWRHTYDAQRKPNPVFLGPVNPLDNDATWLAYVVGVK